MKKSKWTRFMDMHSGGNLKEKWQYIYIEAPEEEAKIIFYNRFGHNPERVTCTCCGDDYSISESDSLEQATAFDRGCEYAYFKGDKEVTKYEAWKLGEGFLPNCSGRYVEMKDTKYSFNEYKQLSDYVLRTDILIIRADEIKPSDRKGDVPEQGYAWKD